MNFDFTLKDCLVGGVKLAKNAHSNKYVYSGYSAGLDSRSEFSLPDSSMGKYVIIFGVYMTSSVHIDNRKRYFKSWYRFNTRIRRSSIFN